ncbi:MAG: amino acid permease [Candidatus Harrisonbacteria bacterium]|nr:amino acid permease [Candidatus Harrisonbacteria bacterium]
MQTGEVKLARTLGLGSIVLLGIGALLGGGIFTLLGPAAGLAGPGLFLAMILGAGVAFLNLQMYIALGTTFPEAGGGYLWVRKGLGNFQGFLAGWMSWFAHTAAAGLYALSFGFYAKEVAILISSEVLSSGLPWEKIFSVAVVILFGYIHWRGAKTSGITGNVIAILLLIVLGLFVIFGSLKMISDPVPTSENFMPLLPSGILGIIAAASFFYIAFEGSEIQVQAGEETRNPQRTIKRGLFYSWGIVSALYILISIVIIGATRDGGPVYQVLSGWGEGAVALSAQTFMPLGRFILIIGGLFANLAALNATIYSSSRVSFALARDKNIWSKLAEIHLKNLTPYLAVIISSLLIIAMVIFLPIFSVASVASLLFILLFMQLNIAGIRIHYKWPDIKWYYKIPFFPVIPLVAVVIYGLLALTMLQVNFIAWIVAIFWLLIGFINYFAYADTVSREEFETSIVYEETVRIGPKKGKRILLPLAPYLTEEEIKNLSEMAFSLTSKFDGELVIVRIHEIPHALPLDQSTLNQKTIEDEKKLFEKLEDWVKEYNDKTGPEIKDINFHSLILVGRDIVDVILDTIKQEECDMLILNWYGYTQTKGVILSSKIDRILRESECDLLVIKDPQPPKSILIAAHPSAGSPYLDLIGALANGISVFYKAKLKLYSMIPGNIPSYFKPNPTEILKALKLKKKDFDEVDIVGGKSIATGILEKAKENDLIIIGSARPRFLSEFKLGGVAETLAKHATSSLLIVRGHEGAAEAFIKRMLMKLRP